MVNDGLAIYNLVRDFNQHVLGIEKRQVGLQTQEEYLLSVKQVKEEVNEFMEAYEAGDISEAGDAMIDLIYFALGVFYKMGLPFNEMFTAVHEANWQKKAGVKPGRDMEGDAVKPEGWAPPNHKAIIANFMEAEGQIKNPIYAQLKDGS